jgi:hypothetical protein
VRWAVRSYSPFIILDMSYFNRDDVNEDVDEDDNDNDEGDEVGKAKKR